MKIPLSFVVTFIILFIGYSTYSLNALICHECTGENNTCSGIYDFGRSKNCSDEKEECLIFTDMSTFTIRKCETDKILEGIQHISNPQSCHRDVKGRSDSFLCLCKSDNCNNCTNYHDCHKITAISNDPLPKDDSFVNDDGPFYPPSFVLLMTMTTLLLLAFNGLNVNPLQFQ